MALTCFNAAKAYVKDLSAVYLSSTSSGALWLKSNMGLQPCSNTSYPDDYKCVPCLGSDLLNLVCKNLKDVQDLMVEGGGEHIKVEKSVCPKLLDPGVGWIAENKDMLATLIPLSGIILFLFLVYRLRFNLIRKCIRRSGSKHLLEDLSPV